MQTSVRKEGIWQALPVNQVQSVASILSTAYELTASVGHLTFDSTDQARPVRSVEL
jgi:hypothetical protein